MHRLKKHKAIMMLLALMLVIGVSVPTTLAYLQAKTDTVKNTFQPVKSVVHDLDISVTGEKVLEGRDWQDGDSFIFLLQRWSADEEQWLTVGTESTVYDKENADFAHFDMSQLVKEQLTEPRTYNFRIIEGQGSLVDVTYDDTRYRFDVKVTADEAGAMDIELVTDRENTKVTQDDEGDFAVAVKFTNTYTEPEEPPVVPDPESISFDIEVDKTVKCQGGKSIGPGGFQFVLTKDSTGESWTKKSDVEGYAAFHMTYDKDDIGKVYIYELSEVEGDSEGVTYDTTEYEIKVAITLDEETNRLIPAITLDGKKVSKVEADFINTYVTPTEPSEPSEPSDPSDPTDPTEPSEPSEPSDPTDPSEPSVPDVPTDPIGPTEPSYPSLPIDPDDPTSDPTTPRDDQTDEGDRDKGIQTEDNFTIFLYLAMMFTSAVIMVLLLVGQRRRTATYTGKRGG